MKISEIITEGYPPIPVELINRIEQLYNSHMPIKDVAIEMNMPLHKISNMLSKQLKNRQLRRNITFSPEEVSLVKQLYDEGLPFNAIADKAGMSNERVVSLLKYNYKERKPRWKGHTPTTPINTHKLISSEQKQQMIQMYIAGKTLKSISSEIKVSPSAVQHYLTKLPNYSELRQQSMSAAGDSFTPGKKGTTKEEVSRMSRLFVDGLSIESIGKVFDLNRKVIEYHLKRLSNYPELKQQRTASIDAHKDDLARQAVTNIYRAGSIGNDRLQGPGGRSNRGRTAGR